MMVYYRDYIRRRSVILKNRDRRRYFFLRPSCRSIIIYLSNHFRVTIQEWVDSVLYELCDKSRRNESCTCAANTIYCEPRILITSGPTEHVNCFPVIGRVRCVNVKA